MEITPIATTLRGLLNLGKKLTIPTFQRGYEWEKDQVEAFWDAVRNTASGESVFFGPVVTLTRQDASSEIQVVDGQQRLTTVFLTLALLRNWVRKQESPLIYKGEDNQQNIDTAIRKEIFFLDEDDAPNPSQARFAAAERIRAVFRDSVLADSPERPLSPKGAKMSPREKEETKDLRRANVILKSLIDEHLGGASHKPSAYSDHNARMRAVLKLRAALLDKFEIFALNLTSEDDAYILFESLNNRGLRLSPGDILRTVSLSGVRKEYPSDESQLETAVERWNNIAESLGEYDLSNFLRHYLLATTNKRVQKKKVVSIFRTQVEKSSPAREIYALEGAAAHYQLLLPPHMHASILHDSETVQLSSAGLNILNETHRLVVLGILLADPNPEGDLRKERARFLRAIESLTFRWLLKGGNAQELETLYQSILYKMRGEGAGAQIPLDYAAGTEHAMKSAPSEPDIRGFPRSERIANLKYVLFRIEVSRSGGLPAPWLKPTVTLEHLAPQTKTAFWERRIEVNAADESVDEESEAYEDVVQKWGNLALLEERLNKSVKNRDWNDKLSGVGKYPGLGGTLFHGTRDVASQSDWNRDVIEHRTEWLAALGLALVSSEWVESGQLSRKTNVVWSPPNEGKS